MSRSQSQKNPFGDFEPAFEPSCPTFQWPQCADRADLHYQSRISTDQGKAARNSARFFPAQRRKCRSPTNNPVESRNAGRSSRSPSLRICRVADIVVQCKFEICS
jgi:hypothetical protein